MQEAAPQARAARGGRDTAAAEEGGDRRAEASRVLRALRRFYGALPQPPSDLFGFYVWEVLSAAAAPARRDAAWLALRRLRALTPDAMARLPAPKLLEAAARCGARRDERVRLLRAGADAFRRARARPAPRRLLDRAREIWRIPFLGPAARHRALLFTAAVPLVPVDEAVARVWARLGGRPDPASLAGVRAERRALARAVPPDLEGRQLAAVYLAHHARAVCRAQAPRCGVCPLRRACASAGAGAVAELAAPRVS